MGLIVMENEREAPTQVFDIGATVINAEIGPNVPLAAVNDPIVPEPEDAMPTAVVLLAQAYVVFERALVKLMALVATPSQMDWFGMLTMSGVGFTVIENVLKEPAQLLENGTIFIRAVTGRVDRLLAINEPMVPEPAVAIPIEVIVLVHPKISLATAPVKETAEVTPPLQITISCIVEISGFG
jgi:hypothetical protein